MLEPLAVLCTFATAFCSLKENRIPASGGKC